MDDLAAFDSTVGRVDQCSVNRGDGDRANHTKTVVVAKAGVVEKPFSAGEISIIETAATAHHASRITFSLGSFWALILI